MTVAKKTTKRKLQAEKTKWKIYACANRLFREKNFEDVTIEEIAEAAGVSAGLFYYYFKNKQEILAIYQENMDSLYLDYFNDISSAGHFESANTLDVLEDMILHICDVCVAWGVRYIRVLYPYLLTEPNFSQAMTNQERPYFMIMNKLFKRGQERGEIAKELAVDRLVQDVTILIRGCIVDWCINGGEENICERSRHAVRVFLRGVADSHDMP